MANMTPCARCNRHVREETCPFCGAKSVQITRINARRVARSALFAASAVALVKCGAVETSPMPLYGAVCVEDAGCNVEQDAHDDTGTLAMYGGPCPGGGCFDASEPDASTDAAADAPSDSPNDVTEDVTND
jgi:hypothetical protein